MPIIDELKHELQDPQQIKSIKKDASSQYFFLKKLTANTLSSEDIITLIFMVNDSIVKSLLILHLLKQKDYLLQLQRASLLESIKNDEPHQPSRLNSWVRQLNPNILTPEIIDQLEPEVAVSILLAITQFAHLNKVQITHLINRYPKPRVVTYWAKHYANLPNAYKLIAHYYSLGEEAIHLALNQLPADKKETVILQMIEHLDLYQTAPRLIYQNPNETRLILAIKKYDNYPNETKYIDYIIRTVDSLLVKNHTFSPEALQALLSLQGNDKFAKINSRLAEPIQKQIRMNAKEGNVALFYPEGQFSVHKTHATITLEEKKADGEYPEHSLIDQLRKLNLTLNGLDYFLFHFESNNQNALGYLAKLVSEFLQFRVTAPANINFVHRITKLMMQDKFNALFRTQLWSALIVYPELFDAKVSYRLLKYNASDTLKTYGLQGGATNLQHVVTLTKNALSLVNPDEDKELITTAQTALTEAECELSILEGGVFNMLFGRFKRCWNYGWSGFFVPNEPLYVTTNHDKPKQTLPYYIPPTPSLEDILNKEVCAFDVASIKALLTYIEKATTQNEVDLRDKLHNIQLYWSSASRDNHGVKLLMVETRGVFEANHARLIELRIERFEIAEAKVLLLHGKQNQALADSITKELSSDIPAAHPASKQPKSYVAQALNTAEQVKTKIGSFFTYGWQINPVASCASVPKPGQL